MAKRSRLNPKATPGGRKVPLMSVIPVRVLAGVALAFMEGARKYGAFNYRNTGVNVSTYVDATMRHVAQYWEGEDIDTESKVGLHHISKAIASLMVLYDGILQDNLTDDRPPAADANWINEANITASKLVDAFPKSAMPFTARKPK